MQEAEKKQKKVKPLKNKEYRILQYVLHSTVLNRDADFSYTPTFRRPIFLGLLASLASSCSRSFNSIPIFYISYLLWVQICKILLSSGSNYRCINVLVSLLKFPSKLQPQTHLIPDQTHSCSNLLAKVSASPKLASYVTNQTRT
jgi:hypothetical protein